MTQIIYPIWRQRLARSLHINRSQMHSKYYQVASVDPSARPKNRTMVFRGFLQGTQNLLSVTDLRSEKISEWQGDGKLHFEICWYFTGSREQYRVAGEVALISNSIKSSYQEFGEQTKTSLIKQQWSNLSDKAKEPFTQAVLKHHLMTVQRCHRRKISLLLQSMILMKLIVAVTQQVILPAVLSVIMSILVTIFVSLFSLLTQSII